MRELKAWTAVLQAYCAIDSTPRRCTSIVHLVAGPMVHHGGAALVGLRGGGAHKR